MLNWRMFALGGPYIFCEAISATFGFGVGYCGYLGFWIVAFMLVRPRLITRPGVIEGYSLIKNERFDGEKLKIPNWARFSGIVVHARVADDGYKGRDCVCLNPMDLIGARNYSESQRAILSKLGSGGWVRLWYDPKKPHKLLVFKEFPGEQLAAVFAGIMSTGVAGYFLYGCFERAEYLAILVGFSLTGLLMGVGAGVVGHTRRKRNN